jgi:hypothetical protein
MVSTWLKTSPIVAALIGLAVGAAAQDTHADEFWRALGSPGPLPEIARKTSLYDRLIGDWDVDIVDLDLGSTPRRSRGEWYFRWVLEGRAVQDVFIAPVRGERDEPLPPGSRYGTTIRMYDPKADVWHLTWVNPVSGVTSILAGRAQEGDIVQEGRRPDGTLMRWTFSEITASSFLWRGEASADGGKSWHLEAEFRGRRKP